MYTVFTHDLCVYARGTSQRKEEKPRVDLRWVVRDYLPAFFVNNWKGLVPRDVLHVHV
jgi:hypothetical protein